MECTAISSSRGSSWPRDPDRVPYAFFICRWVLYHWGFPDGSVGKGSAYNAGDIRDRGSIPRLGRSPGEGKSQIWLSDKDNFSPVPPGSPTVAGTTELLKIQYCKIENVFFICFLCIICLKSILLLLLSCFSHVQLCDHIDGSPPGFPVPGILQARTLEWVVISFFNAWKWKMKVKLLNRVQLLATPWTAAYQAPSSIGFSRQEYWSGLPLPSPLKSITYYNMVLYRRLC